MLILVGLVDAEEYELPGLGCFFYVVPFLVKVLDMSVRDTENQASWAGFRQLQHRLSWYVGACAQELDQDILHREQISCPISYQIFFAEVYGGNFRPLGMSILAGFKGSQGCFMGLCSYLWSIHRAAAVQNN